MATQPINREDEIKAVHEEYNTFYQIGGRLFLVGMGILIGLIWFSSALDQSAYIINLFTTFLGTLATVLVIDYSNRRRDDQRELRQLQEQLVRDAGSTSNETAKNAIHQLRKRGWLIEGGHLLEKGDLSFANLQKSDLSEANLNGANLVDAKLQQAFLMYANLEGTRLFGANLQRADLTGANLKGAYLTGANLKGAYLIGTQLQGANLWNANLEGAELLSANLCGSRMNETTILPNGKNWSPKTDMRDFGCIIE